MPLFSAEKRWWWLIWCCELRWCSWLRWFWMGWWIEWGWWWFVGWCWEWWLGWWLGFGCCKWEGWCPFAKVVPRFRLVFVPTPIPPAAVNVDGIVCNGRGRMWAGDRVQSVGYSVNTSRSCPNFTINKLLWQSFIS